jgi:hypothetical protein
MCKMHVSYVQCLGFSDVDVAGDLVIGLNPKDISLKLVECPEANYFIEYAKISDNR